MKEARKKQNRRKAKRDKPLTAKMIAKKVINSSEHAASAGACGCAPGCVGLPCCSSEP